jgi:uncharacterized protein
MTQSEKIDSLASFSALLRTALEDLLDPTASSFLEMMDVDSVMEFPYAPPGATQRLDGRAALEAHLSGFGEMLKIESMTDLTVHRTHQPGVVILEFGCVGKGVKTGEPYNQRYISVITVRNGRIAHYRDYWNPLVVLSAVGNAEALTTAVVMEPSP